MDGDDYTAYAHTIRLAHYALRNGISNDDVRELVLLQHRLWTPGGGGDPHLDKILEYAAQPGDVEDVIDAKNNDH